MISLIIPTYNRANYIGEMLDSIILQTFKNWECIVIDDGSIDYTDELMEFYCTLDPRIKYYHRPALTQKGPNSCRNHGYMLSQGQYINWIDSDDILLPDSLEKKMLNIGTNDVLISTLVYINDKGEEINKKHHYKSKDIINDYLVGKIVYYSFTPFWSREFISKQNDLFDENISNLDDWDFNLRMLYNKPKVQFIDQPLIKYRIHNKSLSKEISKLNWKEIQSEFLAREKHLRLLKKNKMGDVNKFKLFILKRYTTIFKQSLLLNHPSKDRLFKHLVKQQINNNKFSSLPKIFLAYFSYKLFNRGYNLLPK